MKPLISVIVPIYNIENYVKRCIDSIIHQTYTNLEIILVDDGSTDSSGKICDEYAAQDSRIKVIHKLNGGLSDSRNVGIDDANGEMITFVDGDDFLSNTAIDYMYRAKKKTNAQIVCCLYKLVYEGQAFAFNEKYNKIKMSVYSQEKAIEKMLRQSEFNVSAWAKLYNHELFVGVRYPKGKLYEDLGTTYKLFDKAETIALIRIDGYGYFVRSGSIQQSKFTKSKMAELYFAKEQKKYIDAKFPKLEMATTERLVSSCFHILFAIIEQKNFEKEKFEVEHLIRMNRRKLLLDKGTSRKTRFGCLLSYLGFNAEYMLYSSLKIRGRMIP